MLNPGSCAGGIVGGVGGLILAKLGYVMVTEQVATALLPTCFAGPVGPVVITVGACTLLGFVVGYGMYQWFKGPSKELTEDDLVKGIQAVANELPLDKKREVSTLLKDIVSQMD